MMQLSNQLTQHVKVAISQTLITQLHILQLSGNELEQYVQEKVLENPLLLLHDSTFSRAKTVDSFQFIAATNATLEQDVLEQIPANHGLSATDWQLLLYMIRNLDERLFLTVPTKDIAETFGISLSQVESVLSFFQTLQPIGIGARNVQDYLLIQVGRDPSAPVYAARFIENHLPEVARQAVTVLIRDYSISRKEVMATIAYIRSLQCTPNYANDTAISTYIAEDVALYLLDDEWMIDIVDAQYPKVSLNEDYVSLLKNQPDVEAYYKQHLNEAVQLLHGIDMRHKTLYGICEYVIAYQHPFLERGLTSLKPMKLSDVAEGLAVHESTISRAIRDKYMRTPHGIFPIKTLFSGGLNNFSGQIDSIFSIKNKIKQSIEQEDKNKPLSDQQICLILQNEGIQISRRTVAKYREDMNIASSFLRCADRQSNHL